MKAEFIEKYDKLSDMKIGDAAVSKDRNNFFICINVVDDRYSDARAARTIIDVNDVHNKAPKKLDPNTPVKILGPGAQFKFTVTDPLKR